MDLARRLIVEPVCRKQYARAGCYGHTMFIGAFCGNFAPLGFSEPVWIKALGVLRGILSLDKARRGRESRFTTDEQRRPGSKGPQPGGADLSLGEAAFISFP